MGSAVDQYKTEQEEPKNKILDGLKIELRRGNKN